MMRRLGCLLMILSAFVLLTVGGYILSLLL
jgi:hypothetical protein